MLVGGILQKVLADPFELLTHDRPEPGSLSEVVHEQVVALLGIGPKVEDLRHRRDGLLWAFPTEVGVTREPAGMSAVVATQVEEELVVVVAHGAGEEFV